MTGVRSVLLPWAAATLAGVSACGGGVESRPDVFLVVIDTLRADGLSCYGNPRATSPHLDRLAREGVRFERVLAQAPNTATSHATLFTGLYPWAHRVANLTSLERGTAGLPPAFETLAERFAAGGYQTAAITDGGPLGKTWNLHQGFELLRAKYEGVQAKVDQALELLEGGRDDRPLFLFLHTYEVHQPFAPPDEWIDRFDGAYAGRLRATLAEIQRLRAAGGEEQPDGKLLLREQRDFDDADRAFLRTLYDAEIAYTDHELERIWSHLRETGALARTLIAVTSDHGEEFGEHGSYGHTQLFEESLHVPLILHWPAGGEFAAGVVEQRVGLLDLHPTLLELAGLEHEVPFGGTSWAEALRTGRFADHPVFAETTEHLYTDRPDYAWRRAVREGGHAFLSTVRGEADEELLFRLAEDPHERTPVNATSGGNPPRAALELAARIERHLADQETARTELLRGRPTTFEQHPDQETLRELDGLGYGGEREE